ncbi:hypothetical protein GH714_015257 [Hevea brasiliensis]|uniref:Cytochrome P450 n=1 Tax=Hevea brasiliensis TaxID=3981 RepID=A0A6A6K5U9_HEVBR|nr:hypothetical protein GH714_015257 [Hevea brasiliensis]
MIFAGTNTTAVTLEWAMSNLFNHPQVLEKAKQTLRLCPAAPLLLSHFSKNECTIGGYDVPKNSMLFINAWAIHRDPQLWNDALKFRPERFQKCQAEAEDYGYKFMAFGLGRRACPGMALANILSFALGSMIQCFEWKRVTDKQIDSAEGNGLPMPKAEPLEVMCIARDIIHKELSSFQRNSY